MVALLLMFVLATYNIWNILIKRKKYKTLPLLIFYILTVGYIISQFYYTIDIFDPLYSLCREFFPMLFIFNIGMVQSFIMTELAARLKLNIRMTLMIKPSKKKSDLEE